MAIDPVKIPQNVYVEDRIVGPITLRQLIILLAGGGISYVIWGSLNKAGAPAPLQVFAWIPAILAVAFSFVKIQRISLFRLCFLLAEKSQKPQKRYFKPRDGIEIRFDAKNMKKKKERVIEEKKATHTVEELSSVLDKGPLEQSPESIPTPA